MCFPAWRWIDWLQNHLPSYFDLSKLHQGNICSISHWISTNVFLGTFLDRDLKRLLLNVLMICSLSQICYILALTPRHKILQAWSMQICLAWVYPFICKIWEVERRLLFEQRITCMSVCTDSLSQVFGQSKQTIHELCIHTAAWMHIHRLCRRCPVKGTFGRCHTECFWNTLWYLHKLLCHPSTIASFRLRTHRLSIHLIPRVRQEMYKSYKLCRF